MRDASAKNRLQFEKSPYLLQHADNPVDWYPWSPEAFEKAKEENKPVFLSIGYSTCHWCHVMEHESFENEEIAKMMNDYFVPIKVDREERPDIDNIYMTAVMSMTGQGGWPLTVFLTHDKKPFFGGTYFPPVAKWGTPGIKDIMQSVHTTWSKDRKKIIDSSDAITAMLKDTRKKSGQEDGLDKDVLLQSLHEYQQAYDHRFGGFGHSPKFPTSHNLSLLLRHWKRFDDEKALEMVEHTLRKMAEGGMHDHLGGGFHRYSVDQEWQIPHFEKMLYDQAILSKTYLECYQITKDDFYAGIARDIFAYVLRDMKGVGGGFYSAEDADSFDPYEFEGMTPDIAQAHAKKEGAFYLWTKEHVEKILKDDAGIFNEHFGILPDGNAKSDPHGEFISRNVIYVEQSLTKTAEKFNLSLQEAQVRISEAKKALLSVRAERPRPFLDDKVLTDWNGLMISSLAIGARVLNDADYARAAEDAAQFILAKLVDSKGRLLHRYRDGEASIPGTIEDYAFFINGLLDLYETTSNIDYLEKAVSLAHQMVALFWDDARGGFFFTANDAEKLIFRSKEIYDGAIPSGNSVAAMAMVRLYAVTLDQMWEERLLELFKAFSSEIRRQPSAYAQVLMALDYALGPSQEIVIAENQNGDTVDEFSDIINEYFLPNKIVIKRPYEDAEAKRLFDVAAFVENQTPINGKTAVYLCEEHICKRPVKTAEELSSLLKSVHKGK